MYLSRIELHGFKSFADRTTIEFSDGLTAIVGPNGSGKTNIVDAIRWVLGEQKTSLLRTDGMSQVIFNGTRTRKPVGMAEVSITIENTKKILPAEFSQVVITRRLYRDGESQYLLNGSLCRRKDIVDMFTDTGMGADAYSVIELKMVEQILEDHSDERRHLFEEAAGIVKYKQRRKEALAKLDATRSDVERVLDHITEVRRTVGALKRQAERAERYRALTDELRTLELERHRRTYLHYTHRLEELATHHQQLNNQHAHLTAQLNQADTLLHTLTEDIEALEQQRQQLYETEQQVATQLATVTQQAAVLTERLTSTTATLESLINDAYTRSTKRDTIEEELDKLHALLAQLLQEQAELDANRDRAQNELEQARATLAELRHNLEQFNEPLHRLERERERIGLLRSQLRGTVEQHHERVQALTSQLDRITAALAELDRQQQHHRQAAASLGQTLAQLEQQLATATARRDQLESTIEHLRRRREQLNEEYAHYRAQHTLLASIIEQEQLEIQTDDDFPLTSVVLLGDVVTIPDKWAIALEAALRGMQWYVVVESRSDVAAVAGWLSQNHRGKVHLICKELIPSIPPPPPLPKSLSSVWLSSLIECDEPLASFLRGVLSGVATCRSLEDADTLFEQQPLVTAVVDENGQFRYRSGLLRIGQPLQTEGYSIGRAQRISAVEQELARLDNERSTLADQLRAALDERDTLAIEELIERIRTTERQFHEQGRIIEQLALRYEQLQRDLQQFEAERKAITEELTALAADDAALDEQLRLCDRQRTDLLRQQRDLADAYRTHEAHVTALEVQLHTHQLDSIRLRARIESVHESIARIEAERTTLDSNDQSTLAEQDQVRALRMQLESELATTTTERTQIQATLDDIRSQRRALESRLADRRAELSSTHHHIATMRAELEQLTSRRHELQIEQERFQLLRGQLIEHAHNNYQCELSSLPPQNDMPTEELDAAIGKLEAQIASLGAINFSALEQYTQERQRLEELEKQYRDLQSSETNLRNTIAEINATAGERFLSTLEAIRKHFKELFALLFQGDGEADLVMDGDDPLEARINIVARPKGKRPLTIEMLSGGEKTLTAIALLFAIYLVKPSPFCILDEVDAPLDDANIDRYLRLIRQFSQTTQFLLITHNKRTMEAADVLYGVTMQEPGVSKIVSVRLTDPEPVSPTEPIV